MSTLVNMYVYVCACVLMCVLLEKLSSVTKLSVLLSHPFYTQHYFLMHLASSWITLEY